MLDWAAEREMVILRASPHLPGLMMALTCCFTASTGAKYYPSALSASLFLSINLYLCILSVCQSLCLSHNLSLSLVPLSACSSLSIFLPHLSCPLYTPYSLFPPHCFDELFMVSTHKDLIKNHKGSDSLGLELDL